VQPTGGTLQPGVAPMMEQISNLPSPPVVNIEIAGNRLQPDVGKPFQEYSFHIFIDQEKFTTPYIRFSKLKSALEAFAQQTCKLSFPSSHLFANYQTNEQNVQERARELRAFLQTLLNFPGVDGKVIGARKLHDGLRISSQAKAAFTQVAAARQKYFWSQREEIAAKKADALAQDRARQEAIARTQREDYNAAQNLNHTVSNSEGMNSGTLGQLWYPRRQSFTFKPKFAGGGVATVIGPGGYPWFKRIKTNPSLYYMNEIFKKCKFIITNIAGEPLLILQETYRILNDYKYYLYRIDPKTNRPTLVCQIRRQLQPNGWFFGNYSITLYGFLSAQPQITCKGNWPLNFSFYAGGAMAATVEITKKIRLKGNFRVTIFPHQDVLLFLGITSAISLIRREIEVQRR